MVIDWPESGGCSLHTLSPHPRPLPEYRETGESFAKLRKLVTSPLRRYHDLQMQHQIKHHLLQGAPLFDEERLQVIAAGAQESNVEAKRCERESTRYWLLRFLETRKGQTVSGQVVREHNSRSFVELDETLLVVPLNVSPPLPLGTTVHVVIGHVDARRDILTVRLA